MGCLTLRMTRYAVGALDSHSRTEFSDFHALLMTLIFLAFGPVPQIALQIVLSGKRWNDARDQRPTRGPREGLRMAVGQRNQQTARQHASARERGNLALDWTRGAISPRGQQQYWAGAWTASSPWCQHAPGHRGGRAREQRKRGSEPN